MEPIIKLYRQQKMIILSEKHRPYVDDIKRNFDYYFNSVVLPEGQKILDLSNINTQTLTNGKRYMFSSLPEPAATSEQYIELLELKAGDNVLDLGAYCGVSSLMFAEVVGALGNIIAVEPDPTNYEVMQANLREHNKNSIVSPVQAAVWKRNTTLKFDAEGSMGSSAHSILRGRSGKPVMVNALTVESLTHGMRIDAVKMDIESAEYKVLPAMAPFLKKHRPRIVIEPHWRSRSLLTPWKRGSVDVKYLTRVLRNVGYKVDVVTETGTEYPLIVGMP